MKKNFTFDAFYKAARQNELVYVSKNRLKLNLSNLFRGISFESKRVLDIGAGSGLLSLFGIYMGAKEVVAIEPELRGSNEGSGDRLERLSKTWGTIKVNRAKFQEFSACGEKFDIILLYNSINHLDEEACVTLQCSKEAKNRYEVMFDKMGRLTVIGGKLIIRDCSRYNLFQLAKARNPMASTIEWYKHQPPEVWQALLSKYGFGAARIRWEPLFIAGAIGKVISYLTTSHFCLDMIKE